MSILYVGTAGLAAAKMMIGGGLLGLKQKPKKADEHSVGTLIKDFNNMTLRLRTLKYERKSVKIKLRKVCKELLISPDTLFEEQLSTGTVVCQLWEIKQTVSLDMFSSLYDDQSKIYFLKTSAAEKKLHINSSNDEFFTQFIIGNIQKFPNKFFPIEPLRDLSEKLDSIIDFSSNIEQESKDLLKQAFGDFYKATEKGESLPSREQMSLVFKKTNDKTMQIWDRVLNIAMDV
jgi:hypothetical protein